MCFICIPNHFVDHIFPQVLHRYKVFNVMTELQGIKIFIICTHMHVLHSFSKAIHNICKLLAKFPS